MKYTLPALLIALSVASSLSAQPKDIANSKDHPAVSRFAGSVIKFYDTRNFDAYALRLGPIERGKENAAKKQALEGAVTRIIYQSPKTNSATHIHCAGVSCP